MAVQQRVKAAKELTVALWNKVAAVLAGNQIMGDTSHGSVISRRFLFLHISN